MKELKRKIMDQLEKRFGNYGFKRKKTYDVFVRILDDNIIQTVNFGISHGSIGVFLLNPAVGVTYKDEYNLEMKLREIQPIFPDYVGYKIGLPIGYLMPVNSYIEWRFSKKEDIADSVNEMADAVIKYGFPYLKELSDRDNVIYGLEIRKYRGVQEFQLPVFHYLNGNIKRALDCIDENIKKYLAPHLEEYEIDILTRWLN